MALRVTRWSPDTCPCGIDYEWDDALPQEARVHVANAIVQACAAHAAAAAPAAHLVLVLEENQRKNLFDTEVQARVVLSETRRVEYIYPDSTRVLNVRLTGFTTAQRTALQGVVNTDARFVGKVVLI